jgi:hypothetical protein
MNVYGRSGGITPLFLNLGTRWEQVVSFKARPFNSGKRTLGTHSKKKRLGWPQMRSAYFAEETNVLLLLGIELQYLGQLACNLAIIPTTLTRILNSSYAIASFISLFLNTLPI